jgi:hypothetical protein
MPPTTEPVTGVFLSHSHADKEFVRKLASDLKAAGARVWIDEAELKIGDSLIQKVREGIDTMDYLAVILSPDSVKSSWVQKEVDIAMNQEIEGRMVKVLPLMYRQCELPGFLVGKYYADFTDSYRYALALGQVLKRLELQQSFGTSPATSFSIENLLPVYRALTADARLLLLQAAVDTSEVIAASWDERGSTPKLIVLRTNRLERLITSDAEAQIWEGALKTLLHYGLIQHVASRPGYRAYKLSLDGWALTEHFRRDAL